MFFVSVFYLFVFTFILVLIFVLAATMVLVQVELWFSPATFGVDRYIYILTIRALISIELLGLLLFYSPPRNGLCV